MRDKILYLPVASLPEQGITMRSPPRRVVSGSIHFMRSAVSLER